MTEAVRRGGGRARRRDQAAPDRANVVPPGLPGGQYQPLLPEQVERIHAAALTVLAETAIDLRELDAAQLAQEVKDAEEDVADATADAVRDRAQTKLDQLRQVQAALNL